MKSSARLLSPSFPFAQPFSSSTQLRSDGFEHYRCDRNLSMGINLNNMAKMLKCANNDDTVTMKVRERREIDWSDSRKIAIDAFRLISPLSRHEKGRDPASPCSSRGDVASSLLLFLSSLE